MDNQMIEAATTAIRDQKHCRPTDPCTWCDKPEGCRSLAVAALYAAEMIHHSAIMSALRANRESPK